MSTCVTPACLYRTETLAITERQQQRLQVCENNSLLGTKNSNKSNDGRHEKNDGAKRRDRSADALDRETGEEQTIVGGTRRKDDNLSKRAAELREEGSWRRRGRPSEEGRRGGRLEEEDKRQRRVEKTIR